MGAGGLPAPIFSSIYKEVNLNFSSMAPTTELDAVNVILSGIGEAPVNSFAEITTDVTVARSILYEVSKEVQLEGFHWNTEDNYPLTPNDKGQITISPALVRVHFREPTDKELVIRGNRVYDRVNHTYTFDLSTTLLCTITLLLMFEELPEAARRYITVKALRVYQERVLGSQVLSQFQQQDEGRTRAALMADERKHGVPNMLTGLLPPVGTWQINQALRRGAW